MADCIAGASSSLSIQGKSVFLLWLQRSYTLQAINLLRRNSTLSEQLSSAATLRCLSLIPLP